MINCWEELGEVLAEFENRISYLENLGHSYTPQEPQPEVHVKKIYPYISVDKKALELQKRIVELEGKLEHLDKKRKYNKYLP